jgi:lipoyl(octanoyl) transferase
VTDLLQTHVEIYVFRRRADRVEFLCLRRSPGRRLEGVWQPVTGKIERGETSGAAALREVIEEIGIRPRRLWALESVSIYFDAELDRVKLLPMFAAEVGPRDPVRLSREHDAFRFLAARAAGARFLWEAQRRGLEAVRREVLARPRLACALDVTRKLRSRPRARRSVPTRSRR